MIRAVVLLSAGVLAAAAAIDPAFALTLTDRGGLNISGSTNFADPDELVAHIANIGGGTAMGMSTDRPIRSSPAAASPQAAPPPAASELKNPFPPSFFFGGTWQYPPRRF
jgi:hypothetical protein